MKSNRRLRLAEYCEEIAGNGGMTVGDLSELIDLGCARRATLAIRSEPQAQQRVA